MTSLHTVTFNPTLSFQIDMISESGRLCSRPVPNPCGPVSFSNITSSSSLPGKSREQHSLQMSSWGQIECVMDGSWCLGKAYAKKRNKVDFVDSLPVLMYCYNGITSLSDYSKTYQQRCLSPKMIRLYRFDATSYQRVDVQSPKIFKSNSFVKSILVRKDLFLPKFTQYLHLAIIILTCKTRCIFDIS